MGFFSGCSWFIWYDWRSCPWSLHSWSYVSMGELEGSVLQFNIKAYCSGFNWMVANLLYCIAYSIVLVHCTLCHCNELFCSILHCTLCLIVTLILQNIWRRVVCSVLNNISPSNISNFAFACKILSQLSGYWVNPLLPVAANKGLKIWGIPLWQRHIKLTLMLLVANFAITKWCKKPEKWPIPWHVGTHLRVLSESFQMNTNMTGFR